MIEALDLVLRFDPARGKMLLLVPKSPGEPGTLKRFFEIEVPAEVTLSEFATEIGTAVASFMHARYGNRFRLVEGADGETEETSDTADRTFQDARLLIDRLSDRSKLEDLEAIDTILESASSKGSAEAAAYLRDVWPGLRSVFLRRLSRDTDR